MSKMLFFDIETHSADKRHDMEPREFFRLGQYAWDDGPVVLTEDYDEFMAVVDAAPYVVGHNIFAFDLPALYGNDSLRPLQRGQFRRAVDTMILAHLLTPAPYSYTSRNGHTYYDAAAPNNAMRYYSLDNLAFQFNLPGKMGNLKELAKKHNPPKTLVRDLDFGLIPTDDPEFREYAEGDIVAVRALYKHLMWVLSTSDYDRDYIWREMEIAAVNARITSNGIYIDTAAAQATVDEQARSREEILTWLVNDFDFPTEGKQPWKSDAGKGAIQRILAAYGIVFGEHPEWTATEKGAPSFAGDTLIAITAGTDAEHIGVALAELQGQRSMAQLALESTHADGKAHPDITMFQRSGRFCLPDTHKLVTRRGVLPIEEVRVGDLTLDMFNRWTRVEAVHRYDSAEVHRYSGRSYDIESTPEHRWVQTSESSKEFFVEPLVPGQRRTLQLTPASYPFEPKNCAYWPDMTPRERRAALIGLLVTDGTATRRKDSGGYRFGVYQSEAKFYQEILDFLGDIVTLDYTRPVQANPQNVMHELRLDTGRVESVLKKEKLEFDSGHLRHNPALLEWALTLNMGESLAFLTSVYLSDGTIASGGTNIAMNNRNLVEPVQVAAYRCGFRSHYKVYNGKGLLALLRDRVGVRRFSSPEKSVQNVWCVSTQTGTFTAWAPEGRRPGPYLTGNSYLRPGLTVWDTPNKHVFLADPGHVAVELDFSNADARAVAALSGDREYAKRFDTDEDGNDLYDGHNLNGEALFGKGDYYAPGYDDHGRPILRPLAKLIGHALNYNAGAKKLTSEANKACKTLGIDREFETGDLYDMINNFESTFPRLAAWKNRVVREGESGQVTNEWGRRMVIDKVWDKARGEHRSRSYTQAPALHGQSTTREVMSDALIKLARLGGDWPYRIKGVIHDALWVCLPKKTVDTDIRQVVECMETVFHPKGGIPIPFPVGVGPTGAENFRDASH